MKDTDTSQVAADMHRLANELQALTERADTLAEEGVDTSTANSLMDEQEQVQRELKQLIANLIQLHDESGSVVGEQGEHQLGYNGSVPIPTNANTDLPTPNVGKPAETGEAPAWAEKGGN